MFREWFRFPNLTLTGRQKEMYELGASRAWKAAFENMQQWLMGRRCTEEDVLEYILKELSGD